MRSLNQIEQECRNEIQLVLTRIKTLKQNPPVPNQREAKHNPNLWIKWAIECKNEPYQELRKHLIKTDQTFERISKELETLQAKGDTLYSLSQYVAGETTFPPKDIDDKTLQQAKSARLYFQNNPTKAKSYVERLQNDALAGVQLIKAFKEKPFYVFKYTAKGLAYRDGAIFLKESARLAHDEPTTRHFENKAKAFESLSTKAMKKSKAGSHKKRVSNATNKARGAIHER